MPNAKIPDGWKSYGFTIEFKNNEVFVASLFSGLPAQKAGLQVGDQVLAVNEQPWNCSNYCDCKLKIDDLIHTTAHLTLSIKSGNDIKRVRLSNEKVY